jgi:hypothetical protein
VLDLISTTASLSSVPILSTTRSYPIYHISLTRKLLAARPRAATLLHVAWPGEVHRSPAAMGAFGRGSSLETRPLLPGQGSDELTCSNNLFADLDGQGAMGWGLSLPIARGMSRRGSSPATLASAPHGQGRARDRRSLPARLRRPPWPGG